MAKIALANQDRVQTFCHAIIRISLQEKDEIDTRVAIFENIKSFQERYTKPGDYEALEEAQDFFDDLSFDEIIEFSNECTKKRQEEMEEHLRQAKEEKEMKKDKEEFGQLFNILFTNKLGNKPFILYIGGEEEKEYRKVKSFKFEGEYYAVLEESGQEEEKYFKYVVEKGEEETKEKLIPVNDERLLNLFDFLNL